MNSENRLIGEAASATPILDKLTACGDVRALTPAELAGLPTEMLRARRAANIQDGESR